MLRHTLRGVVELYETIQGAMPEEDFTLPPYPRNRVPEVRLAHCPDGGATPSMMSMIGLASRPGMDSSRPDDVTTTGRFGLLVAFSFLGRQKIILACGELFGIVAWI